MFPDSGTQKISKYSHNEKVFFFSLPLEEASPALKLLEAPGLQVQALHPLLARGLDRLAVGGQGRILPGPRRTLCRGVPTYYILYDRRPATYYHPPKEYKMKETI